MSDKATWVYPVKGLDEHQIGIYQHIEAIIDGSPLYSIEEAYADMGVIHGIAKNENPVQ